MLAGSERDPEDEMTNEDLDELVSQIQILFEQLAVCTPTLI